MVQHSTEITNPQGETLMHWSAGAITAGTLILIPGGSYAPASALWLAKANPWGFVATAAVGLGLIGVGSSGLLHDWGHDRSNPSSAFDVLPGRWYDDDLCDPFTGRTPWCKVYNDNF